MSVNLHKQVPCLSGSKPFKCLGMTLIELLIVIVVLGILAAIALPSYQDSVRKGRRADARNTLMSIAVAQERYRGSHPQYATHIGCLNAYGLNVETPSGGSCDDVGSLDTEFYTFAIATPSASAYRATATPRTGTSQVQDDACGTFAINQNGPLTSLANFAGPECWR